MIHGTIGLKYTDKYFPLENMLPWIVFQISTSLHGLLLVLSLNFLMTMNDICWKNSTFVHIIYTHTHTLFLKFCDKNYVWFIIFENIPYMQEII